MQTHLDAAPACNQAVSELQKNTLAEAQGTQDEAGQKGGLKKMIALILIFFISLFVWLAWIRPRNQRIEREIMKEINQKERLSDINTAKDCLKEIFRER